MPVLKPEDQAVPWNFAEEWATWGPDQSRIVTLDQSQAYCARVTRTHYENFTVASWFLPRKLVPHFEAVYAYCRWSDDLADESETSELALTRLDWWQSEFRTIYNGSPRHPVMVALRQTIERFQIPPEPFERLLVAFRQDQHLKRYDTFEQLLGYCSNSANPVGHLVLYLFECYNPERARLSDDVCTGLQLANFWQDVARDWAMGRVYLPREDRERFGYSDEDLQANRYTAAFGKMMAFQVDRTRDFFARGRALLPLLPRAARIDVSLFVLGGEAILEAIVAQNYNVWAQRPTLSKAHKLKLLLRAWLGV